MNQTVFKLLAKSVYRDSYVMVLSVLLPVGLFLGVGAYQESQPFREQLLVGCILLSVMMGGLNTAGFWTMTQRKKGVFKLLKLSKFSLVKFIAFLVAARLLVFELIALLLLGAGYLAFGLTIGLFGLLAILAMTLLALACFHAIGFIIASRADNEAQMNMSSNLAAFPMLFASSAFYSLNNAPEWVRAISLLNPLEYASAAGRNAMTAGADVTPFAVLALLAAALSWLAVQTFRYE